MSLIGHFDVRSAATLCLKLRDERTQQQNVGLCGESGSCRYGPETTSLTRWQTYNLDGNGQIVGDGSPAIVMLRLQCRYGHRTEEPFLVAKCRLV